MELDALLVPPPAGLIECMALQAGVKPRMPGEGLIPCFTFDQVDVLVVAARDGADPLHLMKLLHDLDISAHASASSYEVAIGLVGQAGLKLGRRVVSRGVAVLPMHDAIAQVIGMPFAWRESQQNFLTRALDPLRINGELRIADLHAVIGGRHESACTWLRQYLGPWSPPTAGVVYIEAEAGKGKSTILSEAALAQLNANAGPLPLYVPLRSLQRGGGISWPDIAGALGLMGPAANAASDAIRNGLALLILDGLDEISGRYDPSIVKGVLDAVFGQLKSGRSRLVMSGRRTEASLLERGSCLQVQLELPATSEQAFTDYAAMVIHGVTPTWHITFPRVPEPPLELPALPDGAPTSQRDEDTILHWIKLVFDDLGKERSLFFVQSLACLARTYQLAGNRPLVIPSPAGAQLARAALYDVCILAASLACIREQDKVEEIARDLFTPSGQLDLLMWLALRSASPESLRAQLPNPNELAKDRFSIDPVNQNEEFTAVVRQIQKHALLFASVDPGIRIGDWRPSFLSDWIRDALVCRAWRNRDAVAKGANGHVIEDAVVTSQRATLAFRYILPELASDGLITDLSLLVDALRRRANEGIPEASAHYWELRTGLHGDAAQYLGEPPEELVPLTDLSDLECAGIELGSAFSGTLVVMVGAQFINCTFRDVRLEQCDLSRAVFSGCSFDGVNVLFCDGPVLFDNCRFERTTFKELRGQALPAATFVDCVFQEDCALEQDELPAPALGYRPVFAFEDCESHVSAVDLLRGVGLGFDSTRVGGISTASETDSDAAAGCLRMLLKPFFPVRAGADGQRQARGYIRSSAIGRGSALPGAPAANAVRVKPNETRLIGNY